MNRIHTLGVAFFISFLIQGKPIFSESRAFISADGTLDRNQQSALIGAGEEMSSYEGKGESNILVTKGGSVSRINLRDSATASVKGGEISHINLHDSATASVKGGEISHINLHDASSLSVSGSSEISHLTLRDETSSKIFDSQVSFLNLTDRSEAHVRVLDIKGGSFSRSGVNVSGGAVTLESDTALHIYGREINFADGKLSGIWADGTYFEFWLIRRIKNNWFWRFWRDGDEYFEIPKSMPNEIIFHQTNVS